MTPTPEALKPCPFCGGRAQITEGITTGLYVECRGCGACSEVRNKDAEVIAAWNRRTKEERK